jgi:hypothetical protein
VLTEVSVRPDALITGIRLYVLVVAIITAVVGTFQIRKWRSYLIQNQLAWIALAFYGVATIFGIGEQLATGTPGGFRTYVTATAVTFALYAVAYSPARAAWRWWQTRRLIRRTIRNRT